MRDNGGLAVWQQNNNKNPKKDAVIGALAVWRQNIPGKKVLIFCGPVASSARSFYQKKEKNSPPVGDLPAAWPGLP